MLDIRGALHANTQDLLDAIDEIFDQFEAGSPSPKGPGLKSSLGPDSKHVILLPTRRQLDKVALKDLPPQFSFATYLSPHGKSGHPIICHNNTILDATSLVALALNETCREMCQGAFYCMLGRTKQRPIACDMIFIDEPWGWLSKTAWDSSNWADRLSMVQAKSKIKLWEKVIPLCVRLLKIDELEVADNPESSQSSGSIINPSSETTGTLCQARDALEPCFHPYATISDPSIERNIYQYSRRIEDLSTYLITFDSQLSTPFICLTGAAEHEVHSSKSTTRDDLSETFTRRLKTKEDPMCNLTKSCDRATSLIASGSVGSHRELIFKLQDAWQRDGDGLRDPDQQIFGRMTYLWQEIVNRIEENRIYDGTFDMNIWNSPT